MKQVEKILVPTDFTVKSLNLVREAIEHSSAPQLEIVLAHAYLPSSITDLLFFSKSRLIEKLSNKEFTEACKLIKSKYDTRIHAMYVDILSSNHASYLNNYLEGNKIDEVYLPENMEMKPTTTDSIDLVPILRKCRHTTVMIPLPKSLVFIPNRVNQVSDLFQ
ncbi:universal stress protein [Limibacter armeniacum]|uniref:universal stress protein n=1 Tax=Limibacter armeniacum TaxID=466084 RepID=UPI002FE522C7